MKKCFHTAHETLTELNITPLLDLAFVLLVIFIITTTPIVNDLDLNLPAGSKHAKDPPRQVRYITVESSGRITVDKKVVEAADLQAYLVNQREEQQAAQANDPTLANSDISVIVRGDGKTKYRQIRAVLDACQTANILKVDLATEAADAKK
jgi:biopolymer transport protein ExbD